MRRASMFPLALMLSVMTFWSCQALFIEADPENSPVENFEILWREFDRYYSYFTYKNVDWQAIYSQYRPQVSELTSDEELFAIFSSMLDHLRDGHVNLYTPLGIYAYSAWWSDYPANYYPDIVRGNYLGPSARTAGNGVFTYGRLADEVGYIHISGFGAVDESYPALAGILEEFRDLGALVVDVRHNGGGSSSNSNLAASHFADQKRLYGYIRWKNGPGHDDFSEPQGLYVEPSATGTFVKPVAVLTNRRVFSAAEDFVLAMRALHHVTVIGDFTGGGAGNPIFRELPNGWAYRLSRWQELTSEMTQYEGIGLMPDILIGITEEDRAAGRDTILDTAISFVMPSARK